MLRLLALTCALATGGAIAEEGGTAVGMVQTVTGPVAPEDLGPTLTHEHILVDFIGAAEVSPDRYDADEVFAVMLPHLLRLREAGVETLVECTPDYLGRDPSLLRRLSLASRVRILTNTGLYKAPYLPERAHTLTADELAAEWISEARGGIGPERVKPGFIKIAVNPGPLVEVQRKIVRAAARTSLATGLPIACHTGSGVAALEEIEILESEGCPASRLIVVHADAEPDRSYDRRIAERGAWISYDGIREGNAADRLALVRRGLEEFPERLLISQDAGWYHVGEAGGGEVVPFDWLPRAFVPMLRDAGVTRTDIDRLLTANPARAFTVR